MNQTFGVIGGDRRQKELAELLKEDGATVHTYGLVPGSDGDAASLEAAVQAEHIILPLPLSKEEGILNGEGEPLPLPILFSRLRPEQCILAGQVKPGEQEEASRHGLRIKDYFLREELTVSNAAATAECAIQSAMERLERTLWGQEVLVLGFGRIGKLLSFRLQGLGCRVTATARKPSDLAWIRAYGYRALETGRLTGCLSPFGVVFNTVPAPVLDDTLLAQLPPGCLCVDLASKNGIDPAAAEDLGIPFLWARFLPGRLAPRTAAAAIREAVYNILSEERGERA